jgi:hypothetical protein
MRGRWRLVLTGTLLLGLQDAVHAQEHLNLAGGATLRQARLHKTSPGITEQLGSTALGVTGSARLGWLVAEVEYFQTNLTSPTGPAAARDAIEGEVMVGAAPLSWLTLVTGPHARAFDRPAFDVERWVLWELRARARLGVVPRLADAYVEVRRVLAAEVSLPEQSSGDVPQPWSGGMGGEAGIKFMPPGAPLWLEVSYRFERYELSDGDWVDTSDGVVVSVGVRR